MTELAAHISDHVLPNVPVRQWVLTVPHRLRFRLGYDHEFSKKVLKIFSDAVYDYYRRATGEALGQTASITFIQRFNSEIALNSLFQRQGPQTHGCRFEAVCCATRVPQSSCYGVCSKANA